MGKFGKNTIAQTFKFDCDRFLRFQTLEDKDKINLDIKKFDELALTRKGIKLMTDEGHKWEEDKYKDLIDTVGKDNLRFPEKLFEKSDSDKPKYIDLLDVLKSEKLPIAVLEGQFKVKGNLLGIKDFKEKYDLDFASARPDILWIRAIGTGSPLIKLEGTNPQFELHIIDVKLAAEPSLKHFTEVTYYALTLFELLKENNLTDKFAVSAEGFIWPGNHDNYAFKNLCRDLKESGDNDYITSALLQTIVPVPYEIYHVHVKQFFKNRLPKVLSQNNQEAEWHVSNGCQLCQYLSHCAKDAKDQNHLSLIPWLSRGQANIIRKYGINTIEELYKVISSNSTEWKAIKNESYQLRADEKGISARVQSLVENQPVIVKERKSALMPAWSNMNIYLTIHFDPGTGITFAIGAKMIYFKPGAEKGAPPLKEERTFIVEKVNNFNPEVERKRLIELIDTIANWLYIAEDDNIAITEERKASGQSTRSDFGKASAHVFFWNSLEVTQLKRMLERHMDHPDMIDSIELLLNLFPPDKILPDPDAFASQPGTVVKDVMKVLVGLPIPHDYTLIEAANSFFPNTRDDGSKFEFKIPYGFSAEMNDQILYERAYEIWKDNIYLTHYSDNPKRPGRRYTKDEIYDGIKDTVKIRISALEHIVNKLREHCREQLVLFKSSVSLKKKASLNLPLMSRQILAFQRLDSASNKIENYQAKALPVDEREAKFISIRGVVPAQREEYAEYIENYCRINKAVYPHWLKVFNFSPLSRDAKIREGSFLLSLTNEDSMNMDVTWYHLLKIPYDEGKRLVNEAGLEEFWMRKTAAEMLAVTLIKMEATSEKPFLLLKINDEDAFDFAIKQGFLNLEKPMVIDPMVKDFEKTALEDVFKLIGGIKEKVKK